MRTKYRRRSAVTWIVWSLAFFTMTVLMAWKFHWLPGNENEAVLVNGSGGANKTASTTKPDVGSVGKPHKHHDDEFVFDQQDEPGGNSPPDFRVPPEFPGRHAPAKLASQQPWLENPRFSNRQPGGERGSDVRTIGHRQKSANPKTGDGAFTRYRQPSRVVQAVYQSPKQQANSSPSLDKLGQIDRLIASGNILAAHKILSSIYWKKPHWRAAIRSRIDRTARSIYFSPTPHYMPPYVVQPNEFLSTIASKYKISWQYLAWLNRTNPRKVRAGQKLKVLKGPFSAIVDLSDREITIHQRRWYVARFPIGIGRDGRTPIGKRSVLEKVQHAQYTGQDEITGRNYVIPGKSPRNPLGTRWIDIGNSYGIHGTNSPKSIGKAESKGCIRMRNADVEILYDFLQRGSEVVIQP